LLTSLDELDHPLPFAALTHTDRADSAGLLQVALDSGFAIRVIRRIDRHIAAREPCVYVENDTAVYPDLKDESFTSGATYWTVWSAEPANRRKAP
jgi:hypothetical protein